MTRELTSGDVGDLYSMLTYMRPHGSDHEAQFINRFLVPLGMEKDQFGNFYKTVGETPVVAWSSHLDTVHRTSGRQNITRDENYVVRLSKGAKNASCLGADDTAGVWLMTQMIKAEAPGFYMFHRGEEVGCKGSRWVAQNAKNFLEGIKFVVALDRRDKGSIITFQSGQRCCSDDFAKSMAGQLLPLVYSEDKTGLYTDSASYVDIVGECTNLSVGYMGAHGGTETLDLRHLAKLYNSLIRVNVNNLVSKRKPGDKESRWSGNSGCWGGEYGDYGHGHWYKDRHRQSHNDWRDEYYSEEFRGGFYEKGVWRNSSKEEWRKWSLRRSLDQGKKTQDPEVRRLIKAIRRNPLAVANLLRDWGVDEPLLLEFLGNSKENKNEDIKVII